MTAVPHTADPARVLADVFGFDAFRGEQEAIIRQVNAGGDAVVLMPTGGGKSICFQIPSLCREGTGVVLSPLVALMHDQVAALRLATRWPGRHRCDGVDRAARQRDPRTGHPHRSPHRPPRGGVGFNRPL